MFRWVLEIATWYYTSFLLRNSKGKRNYKLLQYANITNGKKTHMLISIILQKHESMAMGDNKALKLIQKNIK